MRGDVSQPSRSHGGIEVRLAPLVVTQRLAGEGREEERIIPAGQSLQVPAEPLGEGRGQYKAPGIKTEVTAVKGKPLPPTPKAGRRYKLIDPTKLKPKGK